MQRHTVLHALLCGGFAFAVMQAGAQTTDAVAPVPPCGTDPVPAYGAAGLPVSLTWTDLDWQPPACLGGWPSRFKFVIALAGHVTIADGTVVLARLGAISKMRGLQYYSVTEGASRELIKDASALGENDPQRRRGDFTAEEMASGAGLLFLEEDNRSAHPVIYRMRVTHSDRDRVVVETENVSPVKSFLVTLFPPGSFRATYIFTRFQGSDWGLYVVSASTDDASNLVKLAKASYVNRAQALFQHLARGTDP